MTQQVSRVDGGRFLLELACRGTVHCERHSVEWQGHVQQPCREVHMGRCLIGLLGSTILCIYSMGTSMDWESLRAQLVALDTDVLCFLSHTP
jgi:hypothetical protein